MAGTQRNNTMSEGLMAMLGHIGQLMAAPDADVNMLSGLQQQLVAQIKAPQQAAMQQFAAAGGAVPGMTPSATPSGPPMAGAGIGDPSMGLGGGAPPSPGAGAPPLDLNAMLAGAGAAGGGPRNPYRPYGVHNGGTPPPPDELRRLIQGIS